MNKFFEDWLSREKSARNILIVAHGNFEGDGPSCGAAIDSLKPDAISNKILRSVIIELENAAKPFESELPKSPEDRVKSLSLAIRDNLLTYPALRMITDSKSPEFIKILLMDTISNVLTTSDD